MCHGNSVLELPFFYGTKMRSLTSRILLGAFSFDVGAYNSDNYAVERSAFNACAALVSGVALASTSATAGNDVLCVRGRVSYDLELQIRTYLDEGLKHPFNGSLRYVVLSSHGGELASALRIADKMMRRNLTVVVGDMCISSCSQFMFLSGSRKVVLKNAVLAFHGGPLTDERINSMTSNEGARDHLRREQSAFRAFYAQIGVDLRMLTEPPKDVSERIAGGEFLMWQWPEEKLREFGVSEVYVEG